MASNSKEDIYCKILRSKRRALIDETPEPNDLLEDSRLSPFFTTYEKTELSSLGTRIERIEKFLKFLEWKGPRVYETFCTLLVDTRPSLAKKLHDEEQELEEKRQMNNNNKRVLPQRAIQVDDNNKQEEETEDADIFGLNYCPGPSNHISCISYSGRDLLSQHINTPSHTFQSFWRAMNIDNDLIQKSLRSGNPTAYLIQELASDPNITMERVFTALESIGKGHLYDSLQELLDV